MLLLVVAMSTMAQEENQESVNFLETVDPFVPAGAEAIELYYAWYWEDVMTQYFNQNLLLENQTKEGAQIEILLHSDFKPFIDLDSLKLIMVIEKNEHFDLIIEVNFPEFIIGDQEFKITFKGMDGTIDSFRLPLVIFDSEHRQGFSKAPSGIIEMKSIKSASTKKLVLAEVIEKSFTEYFRKEVGENKFNAKRYRAKSFPQPYDY